MNVQYVQDDQMTRRRLEAESPAADTLCSSLNCDNFEIRAPVTVQHNRSHSPECKTAQIVKFSVLDVL